MIPVIGRLLSGFLFYLSLLPRVKKIFKEFEFDLIFALWAYPDGFGSVLLGKSFNKPVVVEALGSDINLYSNSFLRKRLISWTLKECKKVLAVSGALRNSMMGLGVPGNKIKIVLNGIDVNMFKPLNKSQCRNDLKLPQDRRIVLFIGNLVTVKGVEHLIQAFSCINDNNYLLILLGDGFLREELEAQVFHLGIQEKVHFAGKQPHSRIPLWLNACDVFCLSSLAEGCPNVILEALACGKPIVATEVGGIPEVIRTETEGILVPPGDSIALARGLKKALDTNNGSNDFNKAKYQRTWGHVAEDIFYELRAILNKS